MLYDVCCMLMHGSHSIDSVYSTPRDAEQAALWPHHRAFPTMTAHEEKLIVISGAYLDPVKGMY